MKFNKIDKKTRNRKRNVIWFNPPFNKNVTTNIAHKFLNLVDKHFPKTNKLHKIFNRNTIKVSYGCTNNMSQIIKSHNNNILNEEKKTEVPRCSCTIKERCPLNGGCEIKNVMYKGDVKTETIQKRSYIGISDGPWKVRWRVHKHSFTNVNRKNDTKLAKYIWQVKERGENTEITWSILKQIPSYSNKTKKCPLCLHEKLAIVTYENEKELLNKRNEIISTCRHVNKFLLKNVKTAK